MKWWLTCWVCKVLLWFLALALAACSHAPQGAVVGPAQAQPNWASYAEPAGQAPLPQEAWALLYVWSPRMVLSAQHAGEVAAVARSMGLVFRPVLAAGLEEAEAQEALAYLQGSQPDAVAALQGAPVLQDAALLHSLRRQPHYPRAWLLHKADGQWRHVGRPIIGAMPTAFWRLSITERMEEVGERQP